MSQPIDKRLVDEATDSYIDWREECVAVRDAYDRCAHVPAGDVPLAFSAYRAALDREECASRAYANLVTRGNARREICGLAVPSRPVLKPMRAEKKSRLMEVTKPDRGLVSRMKGEHWPGCYVLAWTGGLTLPTLFIAAFVSIVFGG